MGFFDDLKDSANKALDAAKVVGGKAVEKGKDMAQQGKLGLEIMTLENKVKDLKADLADLAIEQDLFKQNDEVSARVKEIKDMVEQVVAKKTEINLLK